MVTKSQFMVSEPRASAACSSTRPAVFILLMCEAAESGVWAIDFTWLERYMENKNTAQWYIIVKLINPLMQRLEGWWADQIHGHSSWVNVFRIHLTIWSNSRQDKSQGHWDHLGPTYRDHEPVGYWLRHTEEICCKLTGVVEMDIWITNNDYISWHSAMSSKAITYFR